MVRAIASREQAEAEVQMPVAKSVLKELFDHLDEKLKDRGCDHTLLHSLAFIRHHELPEDSFLTWLGKYGGYCDCEVLANVEGKWGEIVGSI